MWYSLWFQPTEQHPELGHRAWLNYFVHTDVHYTLRGEIFTLTFLYENYISLLQKQTRQIVSAAHSCQSGNQDHVPHLSLFAHLALVNRGRLLAMLFKSPLSGRSSPDCLVLLPDFPALIFGLVPWLQLCQFLTCSDCFCPGYRPSFRTAFVSVCSSTDFWFSSFAVRFICRCGLLPQIIHAPRSCVFGHSTSELCQIILHQSPSKLVTAFPNEDFNWSSVFVCCIWVQSQIRVDSRTRRGRALNQLFNEGKKNC